MALKNSPNCDHEEKREYCYLASACTLYYGFPDDCEQLVLLRWYRDNILSKTAEGKRRLEEYYRVAPEIVKNINNSVRKSIVYERIFLIIEQCAKLIKEKKYDEVLKMYTHMFLNLKSEFPKNT